MSDGLKFIAGAIIAGAAAAVLAVPQEMLIGDEQSVSAFVRQHYRQYRALPSHRTVHQETGVRLPAATEPVAFYLDKVYERHQYNQIRDRFGALRESVAAMNMAQASQVVNDMYRATRQRRNNGVESMDIAQAFRLADDRFQATRGLGGITGVEVGWPSYDEITGGYQNGDLITLVGRPSVGKCMHPDTPVLMASGFIRKIKEVRVGDKLMGPDSLPRTVMSTTTGREEMFRITPARGESWVCNRSHMLVLESAANVDLKHTRGSRHVYSVDEYLTLPSRVQRKLRLIRASVEFPEIEVEVSPYFTGLWLGDGTVGWPRISTVDAEIVEAIVEEASRIGYQVRQCEGRAGFCPMYSIGSGKGRDNLVLDHVRGCYRDGEKRIPFNYLHNSRRNRLELLAGIIDTDGWLGGSFFEVTTKYPGLRDDVLYLARSLGLGAASAEKEVNGSIYHRVTITGDVDMVPCRLPRKQASPNLMRKNALRSGFTVESLGEGEYFGVELDGDHLYLLGDFTVTHNTYVLLRQAQQAHLAGHNVLVVTTEMGIEAVARRHAALSFGVNPTLMRRNMLSTHLQRRLRGFYRDMEGAERFRIFSVGMNPRVSSIEAFIQEFMPTIVFIDGVYLLIPENAGRNLTRTDRVSGVFDGLKALTLDANIPIVNTTQFNRAAGKAGVEGSLENIGYSDAIGTHSSIVVAIQTGPTDNPYDSRTLPFLKGREGESGKVHVNFKFAPLNMGELDVSQIRSAPGAAAPAASASVDWMV